MSEIFEEKVSIQSKVDEIVKQASQQQDHEVVKPQNISRSTIFRQYMLKNKQQ